VIVPIGDSALSHRRVLIAKGYRSRDHSRGLANNLSVRVIPAETESFDVLIIDVIHPDVTERHVLCLFNR